MVELHADLRGAAPARAADPVDLRLRWGRAAMASYFVIAATLDAAANQPSWKAVAAGAGNLLDGMHVMLAALLFGSALLFVLGRGVGVIARTWIAYVVVHAAATNTFWLDGPASVFDNSGPFLADIAVAASLLLFLSHHDRTRA